MRRVGRGAHHVLRWLGALAAALALVVGFGLWRLTQGPIALDRFTPYVQTIVDRSVRNLHIVISGVSFGIDHDSGQLDLKLLGVGLSRPDGVRLAMFPAVVTSFSLKSLLHGSLVPTRIVVEQPTLRLVRKSDGSIYYRFGGENADAPRFGADLLAWIADPPNSGATPARFDRLIVRDATIILDDQVSGRRWQFDRVDATAERNRGIVAGDVAFAVAIGASRPEFHTSYRYSAAERAIDLSIEFGAVEPAVLATITPALAPFAALRLPVSGTLTMRLDLAAGDAEGVRADLGFGTGEVASAFLPHGRLGIEQGELHAIYAPETKELKLLRLGLDFGGGSAITVKGQLDDVEPTLIAGIGTGATPLPGELHVSLRNVPVTRFESLWPQTLSPGGRQWVLANVGEGLLEEAALRLGIAVVPGARSAEITSAGGSLRYRDLAIRYLDGLPPVRSVDGTAKFTGKTLVFSPRDGEMAGVRLTGGTVQITDLGDPVEWIAIDLGLAGPLRGVLQTLDSGRLHYAKAIGIDPASVTGRAEGNLHFKLPLLREVRLDQIGYGAKGALHHVAISDIAMGREISDGEFALEIKQTGASLRVRADFDAVPTDIDTKLIFRSKTGPRVRCHVSLTVDDAQRRRLAGGYFDDRVAGPVGVDVDYRGFEGGRSEVVTRLDLRSAALAVAEAGWQKAPGVPATAAFAADLKDDRVTRLRQFDLKAPGLDGRLAIAMMPEGKRIDRIDIERLQIAGSYIAGTVSRRDEGGWRADLRGSRLDLGHWLKMPDKDDASAGEPLAIDARFGRLILGPRRELRDVTAQLRRDADKWRAARVDAKYANGHTLALRFGNEDARHGFDFASDDFGSALSLANITDNIAGGRVSVTGQVSEEAGGRVLQGHIEAENYHLMRAPVFARILSAASLPAVASMLAGSGIPFSTLRGDFVHAKDHLTFEKLIAYGGAIGATANGTIDIGNDRLDLQGTIVPAYTLNTVIGNIPIIGSLLLGGEGQGLFAANYRLTGSSGNPEISVNPLSVLAPGFLRRLFQPDFGRPPAAEKPLGKR